MSRVWQFLALVGSLSLGFIISHFGLYQNFLLPTNIPHNILQSSSSSSAPWRHLVTMGAGPNCNCTLSSQSNVTPSISCSCLQNNPPLSQQQHRPQNCNATNRNLHPTVVREFVKDLPWYADNRTWHYPIRFPRCSMDVCFNYSKCQGAQELLIFSYDTPTSPNRYFSSINKSKWHTEDSEKACLFFVYLDLDRPHRPHPSTLPYWNGGMNHVLITFADMWKQRGPPQESIGFASVMASDIHETIYRPGFDISIPLPGRIHMTELQTVKPLDRKYLLTFRGLRYLGKSGEGIFRSHQSFREMHNGRDIIVATSCRQGTNDLVRKEMPELGAHCDEDEKIYASYSFGDLMNTTFGLVPAGRSPNSYRFVEVLSTGAIPVLVADNYVKPFDNLIHWHLCLLQFPSTEMHRIVPTVRAIDAAEVETRRKYCLTFYNNFFKDDETLMKAAIDSLKSRFIGAFPVQA